MNDRTRRTHRDLVVWQNSIDLTELTYRFTDQYPKAETYGLTNQMRRAAVSVTSNIAEGAARGSHKEFLRFLFIARGSLSELESLVFVSERIGTLSTDSTQELRDTIDKESALLNGLINATRKKVNRQ
jgi:four helix bundle protein